MTARASKDAMESALDDPDGTPQQKFELMLHERTIALERTNEELWQLVHELRARVEELEIQSYDPLRDRFTDGGRVDWFVWEPLGTMTLNYCDRASRAPRATHWDALVDVSDLRDHDRDTLTIYVDVTRYGSTVMPVALAKPVTFRSLCTAVYDFYSSPVPSWDTVEELCDEHSIEYLREVRGEGRDVCWLDLVGSRLYYGEGELWGPNRRDGIQCRGRVRFEGIQVIGNQNTLILGS